MTDQIPDVPIATTRRSLWDRVSIVWLVPLAALLIALGVAWQAYTDRGPLIEIVFDNASGISEGQTELRFRNVAVGKVEDIRFTDNLDQVVVAVRLDPRVAPFVDDSAQFWVIRPEVSTQGVTGLETVLSGVFIEGQWDTTPSATVYLHQGESTAPLMAANEDGLRLILRSTDGALTTAMPLLYKGVPVGRVGDAQVSEDGLSVQAEAVIFAPHDRLIRKATRFWDASGFSLSLGASGATVNFASLASLIVGGATFETFVSGSPPAEDGDVFDIFVYEEDARASVFNRDEGPTLSLAAVFDGNIAGLSIGSAVELEGLRIGEVSGIDGLIDPVRFGNDDVQLVAVMSLQPARLGLEGAGGPTAALDYLAAQVEKGLRARLVTGSLLTGGLKIQLLTVPDAPAAILERDTEPYPTIPTAPSEITDVAATAQGTLTRINNLPIEDLLNSAIGFMDNASMLVGSPEVQAVPGEISGLIADVRAVVGGEAVQAVPAQLTSLLTGIEATVTDLRGVLADVQAQDTVGRLLAAVDAVTLAAGQAGTALEGVPALTDEITALATKVGELPMSEVVAEVTKLIEDVDTIIASSDTQALPRDALSTLRTVRRILDTVQQDGIIANTNAAIVSVGTAADQIGIAAANANGAIDGLPALIDEITALTATAQSLPLTDLVTQATDLMATVDTLVGSEEVAAIPADLSAALADLGEVLDAVRTGGLIENANATLVSARQAADQIAQAAQSLPGVIDQANSLLAAATVAVAGISETSAVVRDARDAMREVTRAAEAVAQLARTIERNPNALIFGN